MRECDVVISALRELSHEELILYAASSTLLIAEAARSSKIGVGGVTGVCSKRSFGFTMDEVEALQIVSRRVAQRCKDLWQLQN